MNLQDTDFEVERGLAEINYKMTVFLFLSQHHMIRELTRLRV